MTYIQNLKTVKTKQQKINIPIQNGQRQQQRS